MRPQKFHLIDAQRRENAKAAIDAAKAGLIVTISAPSRTSEQNALIHKWFSEIATQKGDESMMDIKAYCNLTYGRPILIRDDAEWQAVFGYLFDALPHEKKIKAIRVLDVPFTRRMGVKQLSEYMDHMQRDYREAGFFLSDPALLGYE
jgi:hypothetical protein